MRSLKNLGVGYEYNGVKFRSGCLYSLEFLDRTSSRFYIFKFDSMEKMDGYDKMMHIGEWWCDGIKSDTGMVKKPFITFPISDRVIFKRYR